VRLAFPEQEIQNLVAMKFLLRQEKRIGN